jgi:undecaprenyl-diphosphatase
MMLLLNAPGSGPLAAGFIEYLKLLDTWLFLKINREWTSPFWDSIFPWWRDQNTWTPLYLFLFLFIVMNFGWRSWPWILAIAVTATLTDQVSSSLLKNWINRPRPCNDPFLMYYARLLLSHCPGSGSFTSSHAANHFGAACFIYFTLKPWFKKWGYLFFFWAATVSYGQIYIGVHYPLDVLGGAIIGGLIGCGVAWLFNKRWPLQTIS